MEYVDEIFNPHPHIPHMRIIRIFRIRMANPNVDPVIPRQPEAGVAKPAGGCKAMQGDAVEMQGDARGCRGVQLGCRGCRPRQTMADQSIVISPVLPASPMHLLS